MKMESLAKYAKFFDKSYPKYSDVRYGEIRKLVRIYDNLEASALIKSGEFEKIASLVKPIVAIKNYKSQIPFPEDLSAVVQCLVSVRSVKPDASDALKNHKSQFEKLLSLQGFDLPTVSAILHFCHPNVFPIVDVNVKAACALLKETYPADFLNTDAPTLPAVNTSAINKANKYLAFIKFINRVREHQKKYGEPSDFRYIDKALMVFGDPKRRIEADAFDAR